MPDGENSTATRGGPCEEGKRRAAIVGGIEGSIRPAVQGVGDEGVWVQARWRGGCWMNVVFLHLSDRINSSVRQRDWEMCRAGEGGHVDEAVVVAAVYCS